MGDLIDRQAALDAMKDMHRAAEEWLRDATDDVTKARAESCMASLIEIKLRTEKLPAVQPDHVANVGKKVEGDCISRQAAIDALARMMPRSYTPDGSHPADEEIFMAQEVFADCIEALEILPSAQPEPKWIPCSKRLPAVPVCRCLITRDDGRGSVTVEKALFSFSRWYDNEYLEDGRNREFDISASVIAWAPFPAPYRGGDT